MRKKFDVVTAILVFIVVAAIIISLIVLGIYTYKFIIERTGITIQ